MDKRRKSDNDVNLFISRLIPRIYSIMPMYEEKKQHGDDIVTKIINIVNDLGSISHYFENINIKISKKIKGCSESIIALNSCDFYDNTHVIIRKVVLDVTGDLNRILEELSKRGDN